MKKLCSVLACIAVLVLSSLPVHADYLGDYEASAKYKIQMDAETPGEIEAGYRNRYAAYLDVVEKCVAQYGETNTMEGPSGGMQHFTGLSFLKLIDFNDDGVEELFLAFHVRTNDVLEDWEEHVYIYNIWGYDGEKAVLLQDGNYLYGFNGGYQSVFFVKNEFGTFYLHGAADSFQYNYYYGYTGDRFGLAKTLKWEEEYNPMRNVYMIDGSEVSEGLYNSELKLWKDTSEADEKYSLTFYNNDERDKTWDLIDETILFLQQHCQELSVTQEKGKTLLNVQFHQAMENPPVYSLVLRNNSTGERKTIALLQPPSVNDPKEDQEYTLTYDFSTQLHLMSGNYQFFLYEQGTEEDKIDDPVVMAYYAYDESEKLDDDDPFGNEREYRRLLSTESSPMENADFVSNISDRLTNAGFSSKHADKVISYLKDAPEPYRSLYLYSFYKYSYLNGNDIQFMPAENQIQITEKDMTTILGFYTTFFHETGHGIDYYAGSDGYCTLTSALDEVWEAMEKDLLKAVDDQVSRWMKKNPDKVQCTQAELSDKISDKLYSSDTEITREDCPDFTDNEYKAYVFVEDQIRESMPGAIFVLQYDNGDMSDAFQGWTANKVSKSIAGTKTYGHPANYWWNDEGKSTGKQLNESWAEFYAAKLINDEKLIKSNESIFPSTCKYYESMASEMLNKLKWSL